MPAFIDLSGKPFGYWTVLHRVENDKSSRTHWRCKCSCGTEKTVDGVHLRNGKSQSCGCFRNEQLSLRSLGNCFGRANRKRPYENVFNLLVYAAKKRNIPVELTYEDYLKFTAKTACHYCYAELTWAKYVNRKNGDSQAHNIDRKDNTAGYTVDNCVECCGNCNIGKRDIFTHDQWYLMTEPFRDGRLKHELAEAA